MGIAVAGSAVTMLWLLWLASGVMDCWASRENIDKLPCYAKQVGYAGIVGCCCTVLALVGHAVMETCRCEKKNNSEHNKPPAVDLARLCRRGALLDCYLLIVSK